jgi:hypothetical protein
LTLLQKGNSVGDERYNSAPISSIWTSATWGFLFVLIVFSAAADGQSHFYSGVQQLSLFDAHAQEIGGVSEPPPRRLQRLPLLRFHNYHLFFKAPGPPVGGR